MIRICTSHRTEVLVATFIERLTHERAAAGPFAPVRMVVPNRHVESYVRLRVAEECGIAANIETSFLGNVLASIVESNLPGVRVADAALVEGHLLALLHDDDFLAQPVLDPVRAYLDAGGLDRDSLDRRRCQLASVLSHLFDEYALSRPQMMRAWAAKAPGATRNEMELWQRTLWRAIFAAGGRLHQQFASTQIRTDRLSVLWDEAMAQAPAPFADKTLHVFGLSYMAVGYHHMLATLGRASEVYVYTLSPCREDDLQRKVSADLTDDLYGLSDEAHPLLRRWARPGRENLRLLADQPNAAVYSSFPDNADSGSLLHRLQSDVVHRRLSPPVCLDGSLRVLPCPSVRRELEVVAAEIWKLARKEPSLRLCDVAVIVPDASKDLYLAQLPAVFRETCNLPHTIADVPATSTHRVAEAIALLLRMPLSTFTRKELLPLVTHPCVMARFPNATPESWRELCHELGIVRGGLRSDLDGSYVKRDLFTWDQGLRRLALGALVDDAAPLTVGDEVILPGPAVPADSEEALGFGLLVRSLLADARFAAGNGGTAERPMPQWLDFIRALVTSYIVLDDADTVGKGVVAQFLAALDPLSDLGLDDRAVSYRVAAELALRALESLPSHRGQYLARGVTVASFVPMRAIPFRAVFVLGLGQQAFPRSTSRHELDLRTSQRHAGDVDNREQDLYMFLETLLSAREHVTLSYVARDEITGDELPCSSVLLELRALLTQGLLSATDVQRLFAEERPTLRRYDDDEARRALLPAAEAEHQAKQLGGSTVATAVVAVPPAPAAPQASPLQIPLWALRRFLEDPLQGSARFRLGLREDGTSLVDVEDEAFDMDKGTLTTLVRAAMSDVLVAPVAPELEALWSAYQRRAVHLELAGQSPTGLFRTASLTLERDLIGAWHALLPTVVGSDAAAFRTIRFIEGSHTTAAEILYQPAPTLSVDLPDRQRTVRIAGSTGLCSSGTLVWFTCRAGLSDDGFCREDLHGFLDYVAMTAAGIEPAPAGLRNAVFYLDRGRPSVRVRVFRPFECGQAKSYLSRLCGDLLVGHADNHGRATGVHPYLLPHEAVLRSQREGTRISDEIAELCTKAEGERNLFSSLQGPVPAVLDRYAALPDDEAAAVAQRRFGLFFDVAGEVT